MKGKEPPVQIQAFGFQVSTMHFDPCFAQYGYPFSCDQGIGICIGYNDLLNTVRHQQAGAGRGTSVVCTWFKGDVYCRFRQQAFIRNRFDSMDFGVRTTVCPVKSLADDVAVVYNYTTDHRIGTYSAHAQKGEFLSPAHVD